MLDLRGVVVMHDQTNRTSSAGLDVFIGPGETVAVLGPNGAGKSTLLRCMCGLATTLEGSVGYDGKLIASPSIAACLERGSSGFAPIGYVAQDPDRQSVMPTVFEEACFGPRNLLVPANDVLERVAYALDVCGLSGLEGREVASLSGGQRQRLALAGALAMEPQTLVLDEPCSMLDRPSRERFRALVAREADAGRCIVHASHDAEDVAGYERALIVLDGRVVWDGPVEEVLQSASLRALAGLDDPCGSVPYNVSHDDTAATIPKRAPLCCTGIAVDRAPIPPTLSPLRDSSLGAMVRILDDVSTRLEPGSVTVLAGRNGSGKSTLLRVLAGLERPASGSVRLGGNPVLPGDVGLVFQHAADQLFARSVVDDVAFGPRNHGMNRARAAEAARAALEDVGLDADLLGGRDPLRLSGGQARRVALAGVLARRSSAYLFDEPTAGLDSAGRSMLAALVRGLARDGACVLVASHDLQWALEFADALVLLESGKVVLSGNVCPEALAALCDAGLYGGHHPRGGNR